MLTKRFLAGTVTFITAIMLIGVLFWTTTAAQAETAVADLELISEETGFVAATTPFAPDCIFDEGYQVYLCQPASRTAALAPNPTARAAARALLNSTGLLFIPDSTNKRIMAFDAISGDLIDANFIIMDDEETGTAIHAILSASGNILVSDQTRDVVHEYDFDGNYLGIFAPAGGRDTSILDNIRGIALRPNGHLLVTVASSENANTVAEFDTSGNYLGAFITAGSGGLSSPFDVYQRKDVDWLVSSINNNLVLSYQLATGAPITDFASINSFPQQLLEIGNGNVLVGNFSGTQVGVVELTSSGVLVGVYNPGGVSSYRGVYELPNGNLLTSTSGGVFEIDRSGNLVDTKYSGTARFIEFVRLESLNLRKTVGLDPATCAGTDAIDVAPNTAVTYCFHITNNTSITRTQHDLVDSHLGTILDGFTFTLLPEATIFLTQTAVITQTTVNTATWTAYNPGPTNLIIAEDSAAVTVIPPAISMQKTVGLNPSECASTAEIVVPAGTAVTYCYQVSNTGLTTFSRHDLADSELGTILDGLSFNLLPGASAFITQTAVITQTTSNTATWTAYNPGPVDVVTASDSATVFVGTPAISLTATVGTDPAVCADADAITVTGGTAVTFCYTVTNVGDAPFSRHTVTDTLSGLLSSFDLTLPPGASAALLYTQAVLADAVVSAAWLAETDFYAASATDMVTIVVVPAEEPMFRLYLPVIQKP